ncbi:transcription factor giant [Megachile rotundata]|uniref:transcription factor giant n=1 Tax=Megachile rotundata TaxID=143995 RepID=UPI003FD22654
MEDRRMDPYPKSLMDNVQALDFISRLKPDTKADFSEPPILDLSCKKPTVTVPSKILQDSNSSVDVEQEANNNIADSGCKSPYEGRTFMVTPPSESDSPKKIKYEPIYNSPNSSVNVIGQHGVFSGLPVNIPIPVPAVIPALLSQNVGTVKAVQVGSSSSISTTTPTYSKETMSTLSLDSGKKAPRPFKAYPKDPLSLTVGAAELVYDQNSTEAYSEFRKRMLESVKRSNEGTNVKMRRSTKSPGLPTSTVDEKDAAYWERRRKNNEAAKRSRDARRAKEDEIAIRAAFLEQENIKLKYELVALRNETAKLRCMIYST